MATSLSHDCLRSLLLPLAFFLVALLTSCSQGNPYPRPTGYPRIALPQHTYKTYRQPGCPFSFEYPAYAELLPTSRKDSCSVDLYFPAFDAYWHITDRNYLRDKTRGAQSFEDYRQVIYHHAQKAYNIQETPYTWPGGGGVFFELYGEVPTSAQFYLADSAGGNAVMTAFYFKTAVKNDSLAPVIDFLKADLRHMAETLRFN
jgi:gliding motility-associated lipoprotein GldD